MASPTPVEQPVCERCRTAPSTFGQYQAHGLVLRYLHFCPRCWPVVIEERRRELPPERCGSWPIDFAALRAQLPTWAAEVAPEAVGPAAAYVAEIAAFYGQELPLEFQQWIESETSWMREASPPAS